MHATSTPMRAVSTTKRSTRCQCVPKVESKRSTCRGGRCVQQSLAVHLRERGSACASRRRMNNGAFGAIQSIHAVPTVHASTVVRSFTSVALPLPLPLPTHTRATVSGRQIVRRMERGQVKGWQTNYTNECEVSWTTNAF